MFNYGTIDKTPTINQVAAILKYMENNPDEVFDPKMMMGLSRPNPDTIHLDLNNAHYGIEYEITFNKENEIISFTKLGVWMS